MNTTGCCNSSLNAESLFTMGNYEPASVGQSQMYSFPDAGKRSISSLGAYAMGNSPAGAGIPRSRPYNYETATLGGYNRGEGNPDPMYAVGNFASSGNGGNMVPKMGSGMEQIGTRPVGGIQPVGIFSLWPLVATVIGLAGVAGATYVSNTGVSNITSDASIATAISQPIVKTTSNLATVAGLGLLGYFLFRKDIQKLLK